MCSSVLRIKVKKQLPTQTTSTSLHATDTRLPSTSTNTDNDIVRSSASQIITTEHDYCVDSPKKLKVKYDRILQQLHKKQQNLYNANKRERRAKKTIKNLLNKASRQNMLNEEAMQQLNT
jgi:hypothetical protein